MRNLTINLANHSDRDRNIIIYQKGPESFMQMINLVWRKKIAPKTSKTAISWAENYGFCIGKKEGHNHFETIAIREAYPGNEATVSSDRSTSGLALADPRPTATNVGFRLTLDSSIPYGIRDYCVGFGIDGKLFHGTEQLMPNMTYYLIPVPAYYILAVDNFNEGDVITGEIEQMAQKLEFPAGGILELQLHNQNSWVVKPG